MSYRVVWFKRDLRVWDHAPLAEAARLGPVLCLYVLEPALWRQPDAARQHLGFVQENLKGTEVDLREVEYAACNGMLHTLDPHSVLLSPEAYKEMSSVEFCSHVVRECEVALSPGVGFGPGGEFRACQA